jgi:hypothetical protein
VAYQYLLDWHRDWYVQNLVPLLQSGLKPSSPEIRRLLPGVETGKKGRKKEPELPVYQGRGGEWRLTTAERKRILLNNIYGVDIDRQAVEVTKLSLLLKVLEGENDETISKQLKLFQERALPDLSNNIKCGNSLIGWDILKDNPGLTQEAIDRINPFDWEKEFPEVFQRGGFSVVIGNPPYLRIQGLQEYYGDQIDYFINNFQSAIKRFDLYLLFIEKGFNLLKENGKLGYICPYKFINSDFGSGLRKFLINSNAIESIISFGSNSIFNQVSTYTGIVLLSKVEKESFSYFEFPEMNETDLKNALAGIDKDLFSYYDLNSISSDPWKLVNKEVESIQEKLMDQPCKLKDVFKEILVGVQSGIDNIHILKKMDESHNGIIKLFSEKSNSEVEIEIDLLKPFLMGDDIHRYEPLKNSYYIIYPYKLVNGKTTIINENELKEQYPLGYTYLNTYRKELAEIRARQKTNVKFWYSCHRSRDMNVFEKERLITPYASLGGNMTIAPPGIYHNTKGYSLVPNDSRKEDLRYWLGILNSKVLWWYISNNGYVLRGGYFVFTTDYLNPFPIHIIDFSDPNDVIQHDQMVSLVDRMLSLHKQIHEARTPHEQTGLQRQIEATDGQIDALVYELYGLTEEEIKIVESA